MEWRVNSLGLPEVELDCVPCRYKSLSALSALRPYRTDLFVIILLNDNASEDQSVICQMPCKDLLTIISDLGLYDDGAPEVKTEVCHVRSSLSLSFSPPSPLSLRNPPSLS